MEIKLIKPEKLQSIKNTLDSFMDFYNELDNNKPHTFDYEKCFRMVSYSFTKYYTEINSLIWNENQVLAEMERQQAINKKNAMIEGKIGKFLPDGTRDTSDVRKYTIDNVKEQATWIDGHDIVNRQEEEIKKVKSTILLLERYLSQLAFFPKNVESLMNIKKQQYELFGK